VELDRCPRIAVTRKNGVIVALTPGAQVALIVSDAPSLVVAGLHVAKLAAVV
jgi:hypothetical protein